MPNLVGIGLSQVPTNSMLGGLAYQDPEHASIKNLDLKNLSQINSEIADTAVDIFVYDTSKDSDGGAWRKRTQNTSWYNETLGTTIRGTRKEFPAVAVIVAESGRVTIYDGDDPDLPMWRIFQTSNPYGGPLLWDSSALSLSALNGTVIVGNRHPNSAYSGNGLFQYKFISDIYQVDAQGYSGSHSSGVYFPLINGSNNDTTERTHNLVNYQINDVAMTVLPNAPIDSATGLPIPTIAVGTVGGASVIRDDGTVADITGFSPVDTIHIDGNIIIASTSSSGGNDFIFKTRTPASDEVFTTGIIAGTKNYYMNSNAGTTPLLRDIDCTHTEYDSKNQISYRGGNGGIDIIAPGEAVSSSSSKVNIAYITTSYNTGYQHGDIKGAFLSDTSTTNLSGGNKVTNGDAWSGAQSSTSSTPPTGWTGGNSAQFKTHSGGDGTYIRLVNAGSAQGGPNSYMYQAITTVPGRKYKISVTQYHHATISVFFAASTTVGASNLLSNSWTSSSGNTPRYEQGIFTATGTTTYIRLGITSGTNNYDTGWDNVVVTEVDEDRSVNANGLHSFGTVTKTPVATGAELVAYNNGGSNTNYLKQSYNSDLDFGTGNFSVCVWFRMPDCSTTGFIFDRADSGGNERYAVYTENDAIRLYTYNTSGSAIGTSLASSYDNQWIHYVVSRHSSGLMEAFINGIKTTTTSPVVRNVTNIDAHMVVSGRYNNASANQHLGDIALLRISGSIPSDEQIKKIYEDEKVLFQENAKATLYGSSDAVTALAYDEVTDQLHVGTSAGRSDFQGLRRINNTTTAVTTAISAHDEFIIEQ